MAQQFLSLALGVVHVVVGEIGELLSELSFQPMPFTFELQLVHAQIHLGLDFMAEPLSLNLNLNQVFDCYRCA